MREQLSISSHLSELHRVFVWLDQLLGEDNEVTQDFKVICDELLSNIIHYGLADDNHCNIELTLMIEADEIRLRVVDQARPFNPLSCAAPDLTSATEDRDIGGLGIALTCSLTDDQHYCYEDGRNYLTVTKKII